MSENVQLQEQPFVDRRAESTGQTGIERRQFTNSHDGLTPEARELALATDGYKLQFHRKFINYEEMLEIITSLGYHRD